MTRVLAALAVTWCGWGLAASAQPESPDRGDGGGGGGGGKPRERRFGEPTDAREAEKRTLNRSFEEAYEKGDYPSAEVSLRRLVELDSKNFVPPYNLACVLSMQGKIGDATEALQLAVQRGFSDLRHMQQDANLSAIRHTEVFRGLVANWDAILAKRAELNLEAAKEHFGSRYTYETDERLRLQFVSAFDPAAFARARKEIERCADWWEQEVSGVGTHKQEEAEREKDPWVMVILPTRKDYQTWASNRFGAAWIQIGGSYSDDEKTLVAQDLGPTLRHEYWHVLHWRHMRRLNQMHPVWVMEGLCSLPEDVEVGPDGRMKALPSWRTNMAKRLATGGGLIPWEVLFATKHQRFVTSRPLAQYAQARAIFMYLAEQEKLRAWYAEYTEAYKVDPTGKSAFEAVFKKPIVQVEKDFKAWLRALPMVPEEVPIGGAMLPFKFDVGEGDGVVVKSAVPQSVGRGLRLGDVITRINDMGVHDPSELVRALGQCQVGQEVEVEYRRGTISGSARVVLVKNRG